MALTYDLTAIKKRGEDDYNKLWDDTGRMRPEIESIIFATMSTGLGEITQDNVAEFWARDLIWHRSGGFKMFYTEDDLRAMIGLRTNVANETRQKWMRRIKEKVDWEANQFRSRAVRTPAPDEVTG